MSEGTGMKATVGLGCAVVLANFVLLIAAIVVTVEVLRALGVVR